MSQIQMIQDMDRQGNTISAIAEATGHDRKTVRKILDKTDFNQEMPIKKRGSGGLLEPYIQQIDELMDKQKKLSRKERFTATRMWEFLFVDCCHVELEHAYHTIRRYMKAKHQQELRSNHEKGALKLVWHSGEAQCDFGEASFLIEGNLEKLYFLVLSFPFSNRVFCQLFKGETSECVCEGLLAIFNHIGGIPPLIIFDNATGVGRRIGDKVRQCQMFARFQLHHRFQVRFCNPQSGNEKGNVETAVKYVRSHLFVPTVCIPAGGIAHFNAHTLMRKSGDLRMDVEHYQKGELVKNLFETDSQALLSLPHTPFVVVRYDTFTTDSYGMVKTNSATHSYLLGPRYANRTILCGFGAWDIKFYTPEGELIHEYPRQFGGSSTESVDMLISLDALKYKPNAWMNSQVRETMEPGAFRNYMDHADANARKRGLYLLNETAQEFGFNVAALAMDNIWNGEKENSAADVKTYARRLASFPIGMSSNTTGVSLEPFNALMAQGGNR